MFVTDLISDNEIPTGAVNGSNKDFTIDYTPDPQASLEVFLDDDFQVLNVDYTVSTNVITFAVAPTAGKVVRANYRYIDTDALYEALQNWSEVINDDGNKPENGADVTGDHEADINGSNIVNGEGWTDDTAADAAQATADGKIVTFIQASEPTADGVGDFWIDSDDNNKPYRWSGSAWVAIDNPVADWSKIVNDDDNKPADNATKNDGALADKNTVGTPEIDDGSVLLEKLSASKRILMSCFESLDGWGTYGGNVTQDFGNVNIATTNVANNKSVMWAVPSNWVGLNWSKDFFWQASVKLASITSQEIYFGMGATDLIGALSAVGFKILNGSLYVFTAQESGGSLVYTTQSITGITLTNWNVYRFIHDQSAGTVKFYVNGTLKHTFSSGLPTSNDDSLASFQVKTTVSAKRYLYASDLLISVDR